jgi:hypothetical protein
MCFDVESLREDGLRVREFRALRFNLLSIDPTLPGLA